MVKTVTSFGRSGLSDWLLQRISAVVMTAYMLFMLGYFCSHENVSYEQWVALHSSLAMRIFGLLTIISMAAHAWIGLWCVLTDYITQRLMGPKATLIRIFLQLVMIVVALFYVVWAIDILWRI